MARRLILGAAILALFLIVVMPSLLPLDNARNQVAGTLYVFNDNGGWSWFQDERAIVDTVAEKIIVSSVANLSGAGGATRNGDVEVASLDLSTHLVERFTLSPALEADDHDSASLWLRPDGRYIAFYSKHHTDQFTRHRMSKDAGSVKRWLAEQTFDNGAGTTYSNLHHLPRDNGGVGRLYNFTRSVEFDPNILVSNDLGDTWSYGGRLLAEGDATDRPYVRYFSDGESIHLITSERHPNEFHTSLYHASIQDGKLYNSRGTVADDNLFDNAAVRPASLTPVLLSGAKSKRTPMHRAWPIDIAIDKSGRPYVVFQARANDNPLDHRFLFGRFDGTSWKVEEVAQGGEPLYSAEPDYTGLAALDPNDPSRLFISTRIDPRTRTKMDHHEIFEGKTTDAGSNWTWTPVTFNSSVDNIRPIVPKWDSHHTALLWLRGTYTTFKDYDLDVVGVLH